jgi:adenylate cyclase
LSVMAEVAKNHAGTVVKTIGDELMVAFPDATTLFEAAIGMQQAVNQLAALPGPNGDIKLQLRVGFHFGPAIMAGNDVFGDTVNVAARVARTARAGQIIMSSEMADRLTPAQRNATRTLTNFALRGRTKEMGILEVMWQDGPNVTIVGRTHPPSQMATHRPKLQLSYEGTEQVFDGPAEVTIGREPGNDVVVPHYRVSRRHATISFRHNNWVLRDHSANGSFVAFAGEMQIPLHLGELILHKSGIVSLGLATQSPGGSVGFTLLRPEVKPAGLLSEKMP